MPKDEFGENPISYSRIWGLLIPYSMLIAALYNKGFWGVFDVNIFSYLSPNQLLLLALNALLVMAFSVAAGTLLGINGSRRANAENVESNNSAHAGLATWVMRLCVLSSALMFVLSLIYFPFAIWFTASPIPVLAFFYFLPKEVKEKIDSYGNYARQIAGIIFMVPIMAYGKGQIDAGLIKKGYKFRPLMVNGCDKRFIGKAGDFFFYYEAQSEYVGILLFDPKNEVKIHKQKDLNDCA